MMLDKNMATFLSPQHFQKLVLNWFDHAGRKNLPWQQSKTPYRVWLAEIMLQQTQVATVIPYYQNFLSRFPDLPSLAKAKEDEVLHLWAGLGYYSRARNLHRSAKLIYHQLKGKFPDSLEGLQQLPGIGRSTAGAILSCAFNKKASILDGNVKRLLTRFHALTDPIDQSQTLDKLWALAERYTPLKRVADYSQVMMDLGATICTRKHPRCLECPLSSHCQAHKQGIAQQLPHKKKKAALSTRQTTFLILEYQNKVLLQKRPTQGIWGGLWSLPEIAKKASIKQIKAHCLKQFQLSSEQTLILPAFRHSFTHFRLEIYPAHLKFDAPPFEKVDSQTQIWYSLRRPKIIGLPTPVLLLLDKLR